MVNNITINLYGGQMVTRLTVVKYFVMYKNDKSLSSAPETNIIL